LTFPTKISCYHHGTSRSSPKEPTFNKSQAT
jgi:hypothetical protein